MKIHRLILAALLARAASAQPVPTTYCNPLDIDYKYNFEQINENVSYRSGADPVIVAHKGEYYMFVTISGGWWRSKDLTNWTFVKPQLWPFEDMCAPAALSVKDRLFLFQSTFEQRPILEITDPNTGKMEFFNRWMPRMKGAEGPWDPGIFHDADTDRWFMYFGSSNVFPLYGIECDWNKRLAYKGDPPKGLIRLNPDDHGWERFGQDHEGKIKPFTEGAWVNKHNGKYYLQYGAPGTEYNVYATGTYVGDDPLGPFTYAPYNPVSYRPGGFATGVGHGNTFQDHQGRYWLTGTCWMGLNWGMERRIVMVPAGFDEDGQMFANTRFGDFPHTTDGKWSNWMLLSYKKPIVASSSQAEYPAGNATDENMRTYWVAEKNRPGETLTVDLLQPATVRAVQVNYTDHKSNIFKTDEKVYTQFKLLGSLDGKSWQPLADLGKEPKRDRACAYVPLAKPARVRYVRYVHGYVAAPNLSVCDMRVFGNGEGAAPATPPGLQVKRDTDPRNAFVEWQPVPGAVGYNIRWGIAPDKLYQTYQIWGDQPTKKEIRALNKGVPYSFAVEAFNESGVSALGAVQSVP